MISMPFAYKNPAINGFKEKIYIFIFFFEIEEYLLIEQKFLQFGALIS